MPDRSSTNGLDEPPAEPQADRRPARPTARPAPNPAAVALGRLGGLKGGPARARALSARRRREIARLAANARWDRVRDAQTPDEKS